MASRTGNMISWSSSQANLSNAKSSDDQLNRINLQVLQNRDPYISKIIDQAQRVCVYRFNLEKRNWEKKDLEGTLFVYERVCEPFHGFFLLNTVSRDTFVQIIKSSVEFHNFPTHEVFLQYKTDTGDIYGLWFVSKADFPRVTECMQRLKQYAKQYEDAKILRNRQLLLTKDSNDIQKLLLSAKDRYYKSKLGQEINDNHTNNNDSKEVMPDVPPVLRRLFSAQDSSRNSVENSEEIGGELRRKLYTSGKAALSVTELEKQLLEQSPTPQETRSSSENFQFNSTLNSTRSSSQMMRISDSTQSNYDSVPRNRIRLMTPADFQPLRTTPSPIIFTPTPIQSSTSMLPSLVDRYQVTLSVNKFSKEKLQEILIDILQNDEELVNCLYNVYINRDKLS